MNLTELLKTLAPALEGNMKVTKNDYSRYSVKCYGEDKGDYVTLSADVEGNATESDFDIFNLKVSVNDVEEELPTEQLIDVFCNGSVDPTGVEELEIQCYLNYSKEKSPRRLNLLGVFIFFCFYLRFSSISG